MGQDWKYLLAEDPIPAGTEFLEHSDLYKLNNKPDWWADWFTRKEFHDDRAAFFNTEFNGRRVYVYLLKWSIRANSPSAPRKPVPCIKPMWKPPPTQQPWRYNSEPVSRSLSPFAPGLEMGGCPVHWHPVARLGRSCMDAHSREARLAGTRNALLPLLLLAALLILQAGTVRRLFDDGPRRVRLVWGASTLLVWIALGWACWAVRTGATTRFRNGLAIESQVSAQLRSKLLTYDHIQSCLTLIEWILRWLVVPGKIVPYAAASALWGWRIPWMRAIRMLWDWRWWLAVLLAGMAAVTLPAHFFTAEPHGTVSAQIWLVAFKLTGAYLLAVSFWILLLGWLAVLFGCRQSPAEEQPLPDSVQAGPPEKHGKAAVEPLSAQDS